MTEQLIRQGGMIEGPLVEDSGKSQQLSDPTRVNTRAMFLCLTVSPPNSWGEIRAPPQPPLLPDGWRPRILAWHLHG